MCIWEEMEISLCNGILGKLKVEWKHEYNPKTCKECPEGMKHLRLGEVDALCSSDFGFTLHSILTAFNI